MLNQAAQPTRRAGLLVPGESTNDLRTAAVGTSPVTGPAAQAAAPGFSTPFAGAAAARPPVLIPDNWLDAKRTGDRRYDPTDACAYCRVRRDHTPKMHIEELGLAGGAS